MKNKRLVLTLCVGDEFKTLSTLTHDSIKAYASKTGADFLSIETSSASSPHWEKFQIYDLLNKYDRILYLDTDLIIREDCPDLFSIVPYGQIGLFNEAKFVPREYPLIETSRAYKIQMNNWNGKYFNTGVMMLSKCHKRLFRKPEMEFANFYEQSYLNLVILKEEEENYTEKEPLVYDLHYRFNRMTCLDWAGEERHASYIIHYAGYHYFTTTDGIMSLIGGDLKKWKADAPAFSYRRHLLVSVAGGMGDQLCAEPAVRFLKKMYKDDDIVIKTHWPRFFEHTGLPVFLHHNFTGAPDIPYYLVETFPPPTSVYWSVVSNLLCHTVDYCSMATLNRILPLKDKEFRLTVKPEEEAELREILGGFDITRSVLIHAGRHWESKTLPVEWWQELVDRISGKLPVCLIGANEHLRGVHDISIPENSVNLVDRTSLGCLIAAISKAPVLVSNDSAPVHIAGAFDNWIFLLPTCKHPEHVLPFRRGGVYHKARAFYKRLTIDDCEQKPVAWLEGGSSAEKIRKSWDNYLPEPEEVSSAVLKLFRK